MLLAIAILYICSTEFPLRHVYVLIQFKNNSKHK